LAVSLNLVSAVTLSTSAPAGAIGAVSSAATTSSSCPALGLTTGIPTVGISTSSNGCVTIYATSGDGHVPSGPNPPPGLLTAPIVGIAAAANWGGYWLAAADGGVFASGPGFFGSAAGMRLNAPIVGIAATPDDQGYYLAAADGGVFAFGDATFGGSLAGTHFNAPVVGISVDPSTGGYRLVGADGGVFAYGAPFYGSHGLRGPGPVTGIASEPYGYWLVDRDGSLSQWSAPVGPPADDLTAQSDLGYSLTSAMATFAQNEESFGSTSFLVAALAEFNPPLSFTAGASTRSDDISVTVSADGTSTILAARSSDGDCWYVVRNSIVENASAPWSAPGATFVGVGSFWGGTRNLGHPLTCQASSAPGGPNAATQVFTQSGGLSRLLVLAVTTFGSGAFARGGANAARQGRPRSPEG
jgi:hypothetical protein